MSGLFNTILYVPFFNLLVFLYNTVAFNDFGIAIILLTLIIRLVLSPLSVKTIKSQKALAELQPKIKEVQEKFKNDAQKQTQEVMGLYRRHKVNPFSGCLLMLVQLPILIALFQVFQHGFNSSELQYLYSFVQNPGNLNPVSFWLLDLSRGSIYLGIVAALTQYLQTKMTVVLPAPSGNKNDFSRMLQWQSIYIFPLLILAWSYTLPSALTLYWTVLNIFGIVQEIVMRKIGQGSHT